MAVKAHTLFYKSADDEEANICVQVAHFFDGCNALVLPLQYFCSYALLFLCSPR